MREAIIEFSPEGLFKEAASGLDRRYALVTQNWDQALLKCSVDPFYTSLSPEGYAH